MYIDPYQCIMKHCKIVLFLMGTFKVFLILTENLLDNRTKEFILWCFVLNFSIFKGNDSIEWQRICLFFTVNMLERHKKDIKRNLTIIKITSTYVE